MGFGAAPPRRAPSKRSSSSVKKPKEQADPTVMKEAEKLVQLMLGNEDEILTKVSVEKAYQKFEQTQTKNQTKKRYSSLLEKPWRTTPSDHCSSSYDDDARVTEVVSTNSKHPKSFRRSFSDVSGNQTASDRLNGLLDDKASFEDHSSRSTRSYASSALASELSETQSRLKKATEQIAALKRQNAVLRQGRQGANEDSELSSTDDTGLGMSSNGGSTGLDGGTVQSLQAKVRALERELARERSGREDEADILHENKALIAKIENLERAIAIEEKFKEQKRLQAHENQIKIDELENQIAEYEEKLTEQESRQCEQVQSLLDQIAGTDEKFSEQETRHRSTLKEALAKQMVELEQKYANQEKLVANEMQRKVAELEQQLIRVKGDMQEQEDRQCAQVQALLGQLAQADDKLVEQEKNLRAEMLESTENQRRQVEETFREKTRLESSKLKTEINVLQLQLTESKQKLLEQEERHCVEMQALLEKQASEQAAIGAQRETNQEVAQLQRDLAAANEKANAAIQRLGDLEQAQAREQEILSYELRESESTIAGLMDEVSSLRPLTVELQRAEDELRSTQSELEKSKRRVKDLVQNSHEMLDSLKEARKNEASLREELDLLAPLALDLELAEEALEATRERLAQMEERVDELKKKKGDEDVAKKLQAYYEDQTAELHKELNATYEESKRAQKKATALEQKHDDEMKAMQNELKEATAKISTLKNEAVILRSKVKAAEKTTIRASESDEEVERLQKLVVEKEREIYSLRAEVADQLTQITSSRLQIQELDEERHYTRAKMQELSSLAKTSANGDAEKRTQQLLEEKTEKCAKLTAERNTIKQKLSGLETMVTVLEADNKQKKQLVHELMSSANESPSSQVFIERLQDEHDRTLKRCSDLSLQLAESQFKIDELTAKLRKIQSSSTSSSQEQLRRPSTVRQGSNFKAILSNGLGGGLSRTMSMSLTDVQADESLQSSSMRSASMRGGLFSRGAQS